MTVSAILASTGRGLARAWNTQGTWQVEHVLPDQRVHCLAADRLRPQVIYAGTPSGVLRSADSGHTWASAGLAGRAVKSLAVSQTEPGTVYAGLKPAALFVSRDGGGSWQEVESFQRARAWWWRSPAEADLIAYIQGIALSPADPGVIIAGIEAGAVLRSADGGHTWQGHRPGALRDCHTITFHASDGAWAYEAGGTGAGAAFSRDGGQSWQQPRAGLDRHYGWAVTADPAQPDIWYVSASPVFTWARPGPPAAHVDGHSDAYIFRSMGGRPWQKLAGGLPQPLNYMAYGLATHPAAPGHLYAGLINGELWHTADHGDSWHKMEFNLGRVYLTMVVL